jgi:tetratricopeptide (TPR) repeat protein
LIDWPIGERWFSGIAMLLASALLLSRSSGRATRIAWSFLLAAGIAYGVTLSLLPQNLVNINVAHHYLGAKYSIPYDRFYEVVHAALERPQLAMRDLRHPPAMLRDDPREQRAYLIDLLRAERQDFDAEAPFEALLNQAIGSGAIAREATSILAAALPAKEIPALRRDVHLIFSEHSAEANILHLGKSVAADYGYNGSPFYGFVRRLDPTLHLPFSPATARLNLVVQIAALLGIAWLAGEALDLVVEQRIATAALLFASWDLLGWALPGLILAGVWLPVALALVATRHHRSVETGASIAWAGLIKVFPFYLLLPFVIGSFRTRRAGRADRTAVASCAATASLLAFLALVDGHSWQSFFRKVLVQFQSETYLANGVGSQSWLLALGIHDSPVRPLLRVVAFVASGAMFFVRPSDGDRDPLPRKMLVLLAATGLIVQTWFNYYAVAPLLLLPWLARRHRWLTSAGAASFAIAFLLPEFEDQTLSSRPLLNLLKLTPYVLLPVLLIGLELRPFFTTRSRRAILGAATSLLLGLVFADSWRFREIQNLDTEIQLDLDRGQKALAVEKSARLVSLDPRNPRAHMNRGITLALADHREEAGHAFRRAIDLAPSDPVVHRNFGAWLMADGQHEAAARAFKMALASRPFDDGLLVLLARTETAQGRSDEAEYLLRRALELSPQNERTRADLARLKPTWP